MAKRRGKRREREQKVTINWEKVTPTIIVLGLLIGLVLFVYKLRVSRVTWRNEDGDVWW
jgi:hypothetical protein